MRRHGDRLLPTAYGGHVSFIQLGSLTCIAQNYILQVNIWTYSWNFFHLLSPNTTFYCIELELIT